MQAIHKRFHFVAYETDASSEPKGVPHVFNTEGECRRWLELQGCDPATVRYLIHCAIHNKNVPHDFVNYAGIPIASALCRWNADRDKPLP